MLDEFENETLREIQRGVTAEDPHFAESFQATTHARAHPRHARGLTALITALVVISVLMSIADLPGEAFLFVMMAGTALAWQHRTRPHEQSSSPRP